LVQLESEEQGRPSFSEEKEPGRRAAKRLSVLRALATALPQPPVSESFLVTFFQKSNFFLPAKPQPISL
jgi:hypothetical protein